MARHEAAYLDPTEQFEEPPPGAYYQKDLHLTATGHRLFAAWIEAWLGENRPAWR